MEKGFRGGVKRNKTRRRIREIYRRHKRFLKPGIYLFYVRKKAKDADYHGLLEEFHRLTKKEGLWQE